MSTRAMYTFRSGNRHFHVYKHHDGYPHGAAQTLKAALAFQWPLPRFEADEAAAAFVAAAKSYWFTKELEAFRAGDAAAAAYMRGYGERGAGGGIRLMESAEDWRDVAPGDLEYRYAIGGSDMTQPIVSAWAISSSARGRWTEEKLFDVPLAQFAGASQEQCEALERAHKAKAAQPVKSGLPSLFASLAAQERLS